MTLKYGSKRRKPISLISAIVAIVFSFSLPAGASTLVEIENGQTLDGITAAHADSGATYEEIIRTSDILAALNGIEVTYDEDGNRHAHIVAGEMIDVGLFTTPVFTVAKGDSIWAAIARISPFTRSADLPELAASIGEANNLNTDMVVQPDQVLTLEPVNEQPFVRVPAHIRTVQPGDTLSSIAKVLAQTAGQPELTEALIYALADMNGITDIDLIRPGQELATPVILEWSHPNSLWLTEQRARFLQEEAEEDAVGPESQQLPESPAEEKTNSMLSDTVPFIKKEETSVPVWNAHESGEGDGDDEPEIANTSELQSAEVADAEIGTAMQIEQNPGEGIPQAPELPESVEASNDAGDVPDPLDVPETGYPSEEEASQGLFDAQESPQAEYDDPLDVPEIGYPDEEATLAGDEATEYPTPEEFAVAVAAIDISIEEILGFSFNTDYEDAFAQSHGNRTVEMEGVAWHYTGGEYDSDVETFMRAIGGNAACSRGCSVQVFIPADASTAYKMVPTWDTKALHIGAESNLYMGIEHESKTQPGISLAQVRIGIISSVRMLHESGVAVEPGGLNIIGHAESDPSRRSDWETAWMTPVRESVEKHYNRLYSSLWEQEAEAAADEVADTVETQEEAPWSAPSVETVRSQLSGEYHQVLAAMPTLEYAMEHYNSRGGDSWGPTIPLEDVGRVAYIAGFRGEDLVIQVAIGVAESNEPRNRRDSNNYGPSPFVIGDANINDGGDLSVGIWQIYTNLYTNDSASRDPVANLDPMHNAETAYGLYRTKIGFRHWSAYKSGNYEHFLDEARAAVINAGLIEK